MRATRPPKRTHSPAGLDPRHTLVKTKRECSPSPAPVERRLITSGTRRYAPVPHDCLRSHQEYKKNRLEWVARCVRELETSGLIPVRELIRDDGLIIDWRSHVPVWSDTLKPDLPNPAATVTPAHKSNAQWYGSPTCPESFSNFPTAQDYPAPPDSRPSSKEMLIVPPRLLQRRSSSPHPISDSLPPHEPSSLFSCAGRSQIPERAKPSYDHVSGLVGNVPVASGIPSSHDELVAPLTPLNRTHSPSIVPYPFVATEEQMSGMALDYLHRYVQTYEVDRASLASAYNQNASFAYRVHQIRNTSGVSSTCAGSLQCFASGAKWTRLDIVTALLTLPRLHSNAQSPGTAQVEYDMVCLGGVLGMFVVCRVVHFTKTVVHNFVLQRKEVDAEDGAIKGVWPLTAIAHQILVFQA